MIYALRDAVNVRINALIVNDNQGQFFFSKHFFDKLDIILVNFDINVEILETLFIPTSEEDFCVKFN